MAETKTEELTPFNFRAPASMHKEAKIRAAQCGETVQWLGKFAMKAGLYVVKNLPWDKTAEWGKWSADMQFQVAVRNDLEQAGARSMTVDLNDLLTKCGPNPDIISLLDVIIPYIEAFANRQLENNGKKGEPKK